MGPPTLRRQHSSRYEYPTSFPFSLSFAPDVSPHRRVFRGPQGRRGSFERHMLEGLFLKAFCLSAFSDPSSAHSHKHELPVEHDDRSGNEEHAELQAFYLTSPKRKNQISLGLDNDLSHEDEIVRRTREPRWKGSVPREHLEIIYEEDKSKLFDGYVPVPPEKLEEAADVMGRLQALSPGTVRRFDMKAASREALVFRLLFPQPSTQKATKSTEGATGRKSGVCSPRSKQSPNRHERHSPSRENGDGGGTGKVDGYYALSYRWQSHPEATDPRLANCQKYAKGIPPEKYIATPVSDVMFEAIMEELPEVSEGRFGLWCDQVCINESNDAERNTAVGMMDSIYRAAQKVIIALDDIEVIGEEVEAMIEFSAWHDHHTENGRVPEDQDLHYMRDKPKLRSGVEKIIYSEYFDRAWCAHEFELARDRVVLVRTNQRSPDGRIKVIRIEDDKLHSLMLLLTLLPGQILTPKQAARRVNVELLASRDARDDPDVHSQMVHDMQTLSLIFSMKNGGDPTLPEDLRQYSAVRDKMSIMLNASDLALIPARDLAIEDLPINLAHARIYEYISLLMLASGNPLVLATTSRALPADDEHDSWLRKFWLLDAGLDASFTRLQRPLPIRVDPAPGSRWIELDMLFPCATSGGGILHTASDKFLKHASKFVTDFRNSNSEAIESETELHPLSILENRREYMTHLLACVLECRWTWGYGPLPKGMTTPSPTSPTTARAMMVRPKKRMKYHSEKPWEYFFGFDGDLDQIPESFSWNRKDRDETEQKTAKNMAGELMSGLLQTAPLPETRGDAAAWRPAWFEVSDGENGCSGQEVGGSSKCRYIAMVPKDGGTYRAAIPEVLMGKGYSNLARCWILGEKEGKGNWVVRNRSKLIMETEGLEREYEDGLWEKKSRQKVWGRTRGLMSEEEIV